MKFSKQIIAVGLSALLLGIGTGVVSANNLKFDVTAQLDYESKMMNNGQSYNPVNDRNEAVRPLLYEGELYLPESIIEETAKLNIVYEEDTKELWIGEKTEEIYLDGKDFFETTKELYYTENPKELFIKGRMFKTALKQDVDADAYSSFYFDTRAVSGKMNKLYGTVYIGEFERKLVSEVPVKFRKSKDEGAEVLDYVYLKPGELIDFEIDTRGADIVVMEIGYDSFFAGTRKDNPHNLSFFDLRYK